MITRKDPNENVKRIICCSDARSGKYHALRLDAFTSFGKRPMSNGIILDHES